ncbi:MAG: hypothetical protein GXO50_08310 [Chlorobi bacterium]|nr:hypothetical protein [Chlorobiota bacterium]
MQKFRYIIFIPLILFVFACKSKEKKTILAEVYGKKLYLEDIQDFLPENTDKEDSIMILRNKVNLWIKKQTLLNRAEINLSEKQKDIDYIVREYKESLLIEKYKQEYIKQNLDTDFTESEIEAYYNDYPESFSLNDDIVKAYYFKFPANTNLSKFKQYFLSDKENPENMIKFAEENNGEFIDFTNKWNKLSVISSLLPVSLENAETIVNKTKRIQTRDKNFAYFVLFTDYKTKGEKMPFEFAKEQIKVILLNKRKVNLINNLESKIYNNAVKNGRIKINIK